MQQTTTQSIAAHPPLELGSPSLEEEVKGLRRDIRPEGLSMSVGELASLYQGGDMIIEPRFQRFFRWTNEQKTALVESILLGIPLPQVFVSTREDGVWEVVDGLQRLSTVFQFMGVLKGKDGETVEPLTLTSATHLSRLKGHKWDQLSEPLRRAFRRALMGVSILGWDSSPLAKFDLFERLNTGGSPLSPQEVRNCILVMENEDFFLWLNKLANREEFRDCVAVSDRNKAEGYHMELASRLLIFSDIPEPLKGLGDIGPFVTKNMRAMAQAAARSAWPMEKLELEKVFRDTFSILASPLIGANAFKRHSNDNGGKFKGGFTISAFEAVACGIAHHLRNGKKASDFSAESVLEKIKDMWENDEFRSRSAGRAGISAATRMPSTIPLGRKFFRP